MEIGLIIIGIIIVIFIISAIVTRNSLVEKQKKVERNNSLVDVYLKKRFDLIPNLVEVCKGYSNHEKETLKKVAELRSSFANHPTDENREELNEVYRKFIALVEQYPEIKASEQYLRLQKELTNVENEIGASRRMYINSITEYNNVVMKFPSSIIASMFKFKKYELPKYDYSDVKINFAENKE